MDTDRCRTLRDLRTRVALLPAAYLTSDVLPVACGPLPERAAAIHRHKGFVTAVGKVLELLERAETKAESAIPCTLCHGTGTTHRMRHRGVQVGECRKCEGTGWIENKESVK